MDDTDSPASWAPQSPDLSSYHSAADPDPAFVHPQHRAYRGSVSSATSAPLHSPPASSPVLQSRHAPLPSMPRGVKREQSAHDADYLPDATEKARGKKPQPQAPASGNGLAAAEDAVGAPGAETIVIKNHFPVARIKRIMQADDDVGKVAQVTPVVVSKALELFMISLVTKAAAEAKSRNSKRVAPLHLKQVIVQNEQFDFLTDIVSKVADAPAAGDKSGDSMDVDGKRKKAPAARRKKKSEDEDF